MHQQLPLSSVLIRTLTAVHFDVLHRFRAGFIHSSVVSSINRSSYNECICDTHVHQKAVVETFEMWTWPRMLKISWTVKVTNEEVLVCAHEARSILKMIWHRKHRWLGYVLRHHSLLHDIIKGKMLGKATWSRKKDGVIA